MVVYPTPTPTTIPPTSMVWSPPHWVQLCLNLTPWAPTPGASPGPTSMDSNNTHLPRIICPHISMFILFVQVTQSYLPRVVKPTSSSSTTDKKKPQGQGAAPGKAKVQ